MTGVVRFVWFFGCFVYIYEEIKQARQVPYTHDFCVSWCSDEASPTFSHANANFSVFIDRIRNQFLKK